MPKQVLVPAYTTLLGRAYHADALDVLRRLPAESVALAATLRTVPPLAGAGIDRIAHGYLVSSKLPLELVARAEVEIGRVGTADASALTDLLE